MSRHNIGLAVLQPISPIDGIAATQPRVREKTGTEGTFPDTCLLGSFGS
jgi:hypothetical protein